jgi:AcrR family transcriptional regulator
MAMGQAEKRRLAADDWAAAALDAIGAGGLAAVAVEPLAARLGATKGSFYWHFANRDALVTAALELWERKHTEGVIDTVEREPDPAARLRLLFGTVLLAVETDATEVTLLATADHPLVAPALRRVTERRIGYVAGLFRELGFPPVDARRRGLLAFSAYLGYAQLSHSARDALPAAGAPSRAYLDDVLDLLLHR